MNEFERIAAIEAILCPNRPAHVKVGIGDDAAVLTASPHPQAISVDSAVDGIHFDRQFSTMRQVGYRATVTALSDLAAMGAVPSAILANLQLPATFEDTEVLELARGQADASARYAAPFVGGNLSSGSSLSITTTVVGQLPKPALCRNGAKPGDRLYCSGPIGDAALGLHLLRASSQRSPALHPPDCAPFIDAFLSPQARIAEGMALAGVATACVDISDGLYQDLKHLCLASQVGAHVELANVPHAANFQRTAVENSLDPVALVLGGGDDYQLLFTLPAEATIPAFAACIGAIHSRTQGMCVTVHGRPITDELPPGFQHF